MESTHLQLGSGMKKLIVFLLAFALPAYGQPVQQSGVVQPGHVTTWVTDGVVADGGTLGGNATLSGSFLAFDMMCADSLSDTPLIISCGFSVVSPNTWSALQTFSGGALGLTRSLGDSTTNLATTAFVQAAIGTGGNIVLPNNDIFVGSASNFAVGVAMSGDCTIVAAGTITCTALNGKPVGTSGATIPLLNGANTWSGVQTFTNSDLALLGSSTGKTTFTSANAGASNFITTVPAATDTIVELTQSQVLTNKTIALASNTLTGVAPLASPVFTGVVTSTGGFAAVSGLTISPKLIMTGNWKPLAITDGSETVCTITDSYVTEIFIPATTTVTGVSVVNATAVAGNIQIGLADSTGAPITAARSASTAASGTAVYQRVPFAAPYVAAGPATYYIQLQCSNTGYKFRTHTVGDFSAQVQTSGTYGTFVSFTPSGSFSTTVAPVASLY